MAEETKVLTLLQLRKEIDKAIKVMGGDKKCLIADDDEGNGYHPMYFAVTDISKWEVGDLLYTNLYGVSPQDAVDHYVVIG